MKKALFLLLLFLAPAIFAEDQIPMKLGGFILGRQIHEFENSLNMNTALAIRYQEYLKELEIKETYEFTSGLVCYGTCSQPDRIVRIKLKYRNGSKRFFNTLVDKLKEKYGEPMEWRGDPFHVVIAWKWGFVDREGNHISLILQHNTRDHEQKMGNSIKMTVTNWIDEEEKCFLHKFPELNREDGFQQHHKKMSKKPDWEVLLPQ